MLRSELFNMVWTEPVTKVAARFELSDRGLAKICQRNNIPLPPRGYWARVAAGKYPERAAMPRPDLDDEVNLTGSERARGASPGGNAGTQALSRLLFPGPQKQPQPRQESPAASVLPAPAIEERQAELTGGSRKAEIDPFEVYSSLDAECERAMAVGVEYQRRQAAIAMIKDLVSKATDEDPASAQVLLAWARAVQRRLDQKDPLESMLRSMRNMANNNEKPLWWSTAGA